MRPANAGRVLIAIAIAAALAGCGGRHVASVRGLALQPDGRLVAAGTAGTGNRIAFALARYLPDGGLDPGFGAGGTVTTRFKGTPPGARTFAGAFARAVAVQPDGKLVAAGATTIGGFTSVRHYLALARYHADGRLDAAFGADGTVTTPFETTYNTVPALALSRDGKVVVAGDALLDGALVAGALARYLPDGRLDPTFGTQGVVTTRFDGGGAASVRALAVQDDGRLVAAGFTVIGGRDHFALARYRPDGSLDPTFGASGRVTTVVGFGVKQAIIPGFVGRGAFALVLQPDGKLIAAGATEALQGTAVFALARYLPDGRLDRTFGDGGTVATPFGAGSAAFALALQRDGKVVAAGMTPAGQFALARYLADGALDGTFGVDGRLVTDPGGRGALAVVVQPDGKLVAAGGARTATTDVFALLRYLSDGKPDASFGANGTVTTDFGGAR